MGALTGHSAEVEVVPDDLLQLVVQGAFLEAQAEVAAEVLIDDSPYGSGGKIRLATHRESGTR